MTYRELVNNLSNEEFAQALIDDVLLHMACNCSIIGDEAVCPYETKDCLKCIVMLLNSEVENFNKI